MRRYLFPLLLSSILLRAHAEVYWVLDYNMTTISYNPATTNYNPKYDYYPGLIAMQSQGNNQAESGSAASPVNAKSSQIAEIQSQIAELKRQRNLPENSWSTVPIKDMFAAAARTRQINTDIQNLEDRLTTLMTGQAPVRVVTQATPRRTINCFSYGLGNAFTTCN